MAPPGALSAAFCTVAEKKFPEGELPLAPTEASRPPPPSFPVSHNPASASKTARIPGPACRQYGPS